MVPFLQLDGIPIHACDDPAFFYEKKASRRVQQYLGIPAQRTASLHLVAVRWGVTGNNVGSTCMG